MRIDFPDLSDPALTPPVTAIAEQRGGLPDLYRLLLHSPPFAQGWLTLLTAVRQQGCLTRGDPRIGDPARRFAQRRRL